MSRTKSEGEKAFEEAGEMLSALLLKVHPKSRIYMERMPVWRIHVANVFSTFMTDDDMKALGITGRGMFSLVRMLTNKPSNNKRLVYITKRCATAMTEQTEEWEKVKKLVEEKWDELERKRFETRKKLISEGYTEVGVKFADLSYRFVLTDAAPYFVKLLVEKSGMTVFYDDDDMYDYGVSSEYVDIRNALGEKCRITPAINQYRVLFDQNDPFSVTILTEVTEKKSEGAPVTKSETVSEEMRVNELFGTW